MGWATEFVLVVGQREGRGGDYCEPDLATCGYAAYWDLA